MTTRNEFVRLALVCIAIGLLVCAWSFAVPSTVIRFQDVAGQSGIRAQIRCGGPEKKWIPEANGSGAAWLDYDRDGKVDLFVANYVQWTAKNDLWCSLDGVTNPLSTSTAS